MRPKSHRTVEDSLDLIDIIIAIIAFRAGVVNVKLDAFQVSTDEDIWLLAPEVDDRQEGAMTDDQTGAVCNSIDLDRGGCGGEVGCFLKPKGPLQTKVHLISIIWPKIKSKIS